MKRMNLELDDGDYRYVKDRALREQRSVAAVIRDAIARMRRLDVPEVRTDPMYEVGSFDGPADLAEGHDKYLYGP